MGSRDWQRTSPDFLTSLKLVPLFSEIEELRLALLATSCRTRELSPGQILFYQNDPAEAVFFVLSGSIEIFLSTPDGRELVINEMHPGDCFGELSLLTDQPRSTGARAGSATRILSVPRDRFLTWLRAEPDLMRQLLETTAQRLMISSERESALAFLDSGARTARVLLQLEAQEEGAGQVSITQEELARYVGLTRQTVAKTLGIWRRQGWIRTGRGQIEILDTNRINKIAERGT
jgi:CRP/FNR family transcriptional regulator